MAAITLAENQPHRFDPFKKAVEDVFKSEIDKAVTARFTGKEMPPAAELKATKAEILKELAEFYRAEIDRYIKETISTVVEAFFGWGHQEHYWVGFYEFMPKLGVVFDEKPAELLKLYGILSRAMGWWMPFDGAVFCCERPTVMQVNDRRVYHCDNGPVVAYADGYEIHAIDGNLLPKKVVETPEELTIEEIDNEENQEIRRIMVERTGWERYLKLANAEVLDQAVNPGANVVEFLMKTKRECVLVAPCPTGRIFPIPVPLETKTVAEAQNYLCAFKERFVAEA